jgi:hypothetical protein
MAGLTASDLAAITQNTGEGESGLTPDALAQITSQPVSTEPLSLSNAAIQGYANIGPSALKFGQGLMQAASHPLDTVQTLGDLGAGLVRNLEPTQIRDWMDRLDWNPEKAKQASSLADQVAMEAKSKYGNWEGFKQAFAKDPVGTMSDLSAVFTGGSAALGAAGKVGSVASKAAKAKGAISAAGALEKGGEAATQAGDILGTAGTYTNPLAAPTAIAGNVLPHALGLTTGVGSEAIKNAYAAGTEGDQGFLSAMRGTMPWDKPLEDAKYNLNVMRQNRGNAYRSGMVDISNDKSLLDFGDIDNAIAQARNDVGYGVNVKDPEGLKKINEIEQKINQWKNPMDANGNPVNPDMYRTPEGLDALKQAVGHIVDATDQSARGAQRVGGNIYNAIKKTISDQAPTYDKVMSDYSEASDQLREIEKSLSLGNKATADTAMRKLQSLTRNNVNTNYGGRLSLAQQLEQEGGRPFIRQLSGQAFNSGTARGMAGTLEGMAGVGGLINPLAWAAIPAQTPRLVGEAAYKLGQVAGPASRMMDRIGVTPAGANTLMSIYNQRPNQ